MLSGYLKINSQFALILFSLLFLSLRLLWLKTNNLELYADEAQYWIWSKSLDWGYYSKPPFVAWVIAVSTYFFGDSEFAIRCFSPFIHFFTSFVIYLIGCRSYDKEVGFLAAMIYITMPAVFISSTIISTDPILLLFWSLTLFSFMQALNTGNIAWWVLCGVLAGGGMLTKYSMLFFMFSTLIYLYTLHKSVRFVFSKEFLIAAFLAFLIFIPNLVWNLNNGLVSFLHTADLIEAESYQKFSFKRILEFVVAQFGMFGPITFGLLLYSIYIFLNKKLDRTYAILFHFSIPILLVMVIIAFVTRAHANWAAPIYISSSLLIVLIARSYGCLRLIKFSIILHIIIGLGLMFYQPIIKSLGYEITANIDIYKRLKGGKKLGENLIHYSELYPNSVIAIDTRREIALLTYYSRAKRLEIIKWNPSKQITDYFALTTDANKYIGRDMLIVMEYINHSHTEIVKNQLKQYASTVRFLGISDSEAYTGYSFKEQVFYLNNFRGY